MWGKLLTGVGWENFIKLLPLVSQKHTSGLGGSQGMHCGGQQCGKARSPALLIQNTRKKSRLWNWQSGAGCVPKNPLTLSDIISEFLSSFSLSFPDNTNKRLNYSPWDSFFSYYPLASCWRSLYIYLYISPAHLHTPGRTPSPVSGLKAADPVRNRPWWLTSRLVKKRGVGLRTTAVTRSAGVAAASAACPDPSSGSLCFLLPPPVSNTNTTVRETSEYDALAHTKSPAAHFWSAVR